MNKERHGLFAELTPPPGGAERFAERLDEAAGAPVAPRWRGFALVGVAAAAIALVVAAVLLREPPDTHTPLAASAPNLSAAPEFDRLLGRPARPTELSVTVDSRTASVVEVETLNEKIRIYSVN